MNHEQFEQLVSAWLDAPDDLALRERIEAALRADPARAAEFAEWQALDRVIRAGVPEPRGIDWDRLRAHIAAGVDAADDADVALDRVLAAEARLDRQVDWQRQRQHIAAAIAAETRAAVRRRRAQWIGGLTTFAAAAAAVVLAILPAPVAPVPVQASDAVVLVRVGGESGRDSFAADSVAEVRIVAAALPAADDAPRFFAIDPRQPTSTVEEVVSLY
jgi:hypothetical protein